MNSSGETDTEKIIDASVCSSVQSNQMNMFRTIIIVPQLAVYIYNRASFIFHDGLICNKQLSHLSLSTSDAGDAVKSNVKQRP